MRVGTDPQHLAGRRHVAYGRDTVYVERSPHPVYSTRTTSHCDVWSAHGGDHSNTPVSSEPAPPAAVVGTAILVGFEPNEHGASVLGDLAAMGSSITLALYLLAGRWLRRAHQLTTYVVGVYGWGAIAALPAAVATFDAGIPREATLRILLLGIGPLAIGHTLINASLRRLPATVPNVIATQEVPAGILLGVVTLHEVPGPGTLIGGAIALVGVIIVIVGEPLAHDHPLLPKAKTAA